MASLVNGALHAALLLCCLVAPDFLPVQLPCANGQSISPFSEEAGTQVGGSVGPELGPGEVAALMSNGTGDEFTATAANYHELVLALMSPGVIAIRLTNHIALPPSSVEEDLLSLASTPKWQQLLQKELQLLDLRGSFYHRTAFPVVNRPVAIIGQCTQQSSQVQDDAVQDGFYGCAIDAGLSARHFYVAGTSSYLKLVRIHILNGFPNNSPAFGIKLPMFPPTLNEYSWMPSYSGWGGVQGGGCILLTNRGRLEMRQGIMKGCKTGGLADGGAVFAGKWANALFYQVNFTDNFATDDGGAVNMYFAAKATLIECKFSGNKAGIDGEWGHDGDDIFLQGSSDVKLFIYPETDYQSMVQSVCIGYVTENNCPVQYIQSVEGKLNEIGGEEVAAMLQQPPSDLHNSLGLPPSLENYKIPNLSNGPLTPFCSAGFCGTYAYPFGCGCDFFCGYYGDCCWDVCCGCGIACPDTGFKPNTEYVLEEGQCPDYSSPPSPPETPLASPPPRDLCPLIGNGDVDGNGFLEVLDFVAMLNHVFGKPQEFMCVEEVGDGNHDGTLNVIDVVGFVMLATGQGCPSGFTSVDYDTVAFSFCECNPDAVECV